MAATRSLQDAAEGLCPRGWHPLVWIALSLKLEKSIFIDIFFLNECVLNAISQNTFKKSFSEKNKTRIRLSRHRPGQVALLQDIQHTLRVLTLGGMRHTMLPIGQHDSYNPSRVP